MSIVSIIGPMFSGKSSELLKRIETYKITHDSAKMCIIVSKKDTRYGENSIITHNKLSSENLNITTFSVISLKEIEDKLDNFDIIFIDECQFIDIDFDKNVSTNEEKTTHHHNNHHRNYLDLLRSKGKKIYVAFLNGNTNRQSFNMQMVSLFEISTDIIFLKSVCSCDRDACYTIRIDDKEAIIDVGGADKYRPVCGRCWDEKNKK